MREFYIYLTGRGDQAANPSYTFSSPIDFSNGQKGEIALCEVIMRKNWLNGRDLWIVVSNLTSPEKNTKTVHLRNTYYESFEKFKDKLMNELKKTDFSGGKMDGIFQITKSNTVSGIFNLKLAPYHVIKFSPNLCDVLNIRNNIIVNRSNEEVLITFINPDINIRFNRILFCSNDILPSYINDTTIPVLRATSLTEMRYGENIQHEWSDPIYISIRTPMVLHKLTINITDTYGKLLPIKGGETSLLLHMRIKD